MLRCKSLGTGRRDDLLVLGIGLFSIVFTLAVALLV